jgi:hypothetical protein
MRSLFVALAPLLLATVAAGCGGTRTITHTVTVHAQPAVQSPDQRFYGRVTSLVRSGAHYELRLDPSWFLSGVTANTAAAEDSGTHCLPSACSPVANDNYTVDEGHRTLAFIVPADVHGTVLVQRAMPGSPFPASSITVGQLAQIVAGRSTLKLFEPLTSGVWVLVHIDTVRSFAQQYRP